ncbi:MAG: dienelactone hydrolase family protein [Chloroflexi bacterium]|nr:dienelactone hydrolase family protein [Chloroflexota bacterium]
MAETLDSASGVSVLRNAGAGAAWTFVYAPGAGSNLRDPFGQHLAERLPEAGISLVRFQFPYQEAGSRRPDRPATLLATWRAVLESSRPTDVTRIAVGGRSLGGRIASVLASEGAAVDALALFAYPAHPPGKPERLRTAHLPAIACPALFCSGTRDPFASPDELAAVAALVPNARLHLLEGADHGFATLKSSGRSREDVWDEAAGVLVAWLRSL